MALGATGQSGQRKVFVNARLLDPASGLDTRGALLVEEGCIADVSPGMAASSAPSDTEIIDCGGHVLAPGLVDMRVFAGEPGFEHRETLGGVSRSAAAGGVTTLVCRPDTEPVIDDVALVDFIERRARDTAQVHVHPMAALTRGLAGTQMTEIGLLSQAGAIAFSDGDRAVANAMTMRRALAYARGFDALVIGQAVDAALAGDGVMNEGEVSARLGLPGIPSAAETIIVERDLALVELTGGRFHFGTLSVAPSLEAVQRARDRGLTVTCGVSINNLVLNQNDIGQYRTFFKLTPPLRTETDRAAMVEGLAAGPIDVIVSDHDPQDVDTKRRPFVEAAFGAIGLETMLPCALSLFHNEEIALAPLLAAMTCNPARILGLDCGRLATGAPADLVLIDLEGTWAVEPATLTSKCKNTPFETAKMQGRALLTMVAGHTVYSAKGW
ncbi:MAG: dihydroorotase [Alphaproteobacteria bacterium]